MLQRLTLVSIIFVVAGLRTTALAVEPHADRVILAEAPRDTIDGGRHLLAGIAAFAGTVPAAITTLAAVVFLETGESRTLLSRVLLEDLLMPRPDIFEALLNGLPVISPLEFAHLPCIVDFLIRVKNDLMIIVECHVVEKLKERQLVCQL